MDITPFMQGFQGLEPTLETGSILAFFIRLRLQSQDINEIIGTLGDRIGRYLHLSTGQ